MSDDLSTNATTLRWGRLLAGSFAAVVLVSFALGIVAAVVGRSTTRLGEGAGGLFAFPSLVTTALALASIPLAIVIARRSATRRIRSAAVLVGGAWVIAVGYIGVAHALDPCTNGWWDTSSRIGGQRLCERFGSDLNWHTRFHLLAHAAPAVLMVWLYAAAVRRFVEPAARVPTPAHGPTTRCSGTP